MDGEAAISASPAPREFPSRSGHPGATRVNLHRETEADRTAPSPNMPVAAMTAAMANLDESAFVEFHRGYHRRLYGYAFVLARGQADVAQDLVQETMLRVVRHVKPFSTERDLWNWLVRLLRTAAADQGRKTNRWQAFLEAWVPIFVSRQHDEPAEVVDTDATLARALDQIDPADAQLLRQKYLDNQSVRDIAATCEATEKAIESRLTRARQALRDALSRMNEQEQEP